MRPTLLFLFTLCTLTLSATTRKVLFVGNSYTYTNSMPDMLRDFVSAKGDTLVYTMSAPGGYTFQQHTSLAGTLSGIASQPWDVVVLQEQSQLPSFPPAQVATDCYPYARMLDSLVDENDSCIETMFMMTWGRRDGDAMNCPGYPVVCTYAGMQGRLRESYMEMSQDNHASVAPVGAAWKMVRDSFPGIDLYQADGSHQSAAGAYLQVCVFYASIFHRPAFGGSYLGGLSATTAATLQRIADKVVLDSLSQWQQYGHYPYATFSSSHMAGFGVSFTNASQRADTYSWSFGDGATSTATSPSHTYTAAGIYTVTLTALNECRSEVFVNTVHVGVVSLVSEPEQLALPVTIRNGNNGNITFVIPAGAHCAALRVSGVDGREVARVVAPANTCQVQLLPGFYILHATDDKGNITVVRFAAY